jgi:L-ascorbate metabolism protein UlaG (beta-lactamase superfamily)
MKLTKYGHACVRLDADGAGVGAIVVDPGKFTDVAAALAGAAYILVTHEHDDHVDYPKVAAALMENPGLKLWANNTVVAQLEAAGAPAHQLITLTPGDWLEVPGWQVRAGGGWHKPIRSGMPRFHNLTYTISADGGTVFHPGDSLDLPYSAVDVLCVPISGPWLALGEAIDYVHDADARLAVAIHDSLNTDIGSQLWEFRLEDQALVSPTEFRRLKIGESLKVS